MIDVLVNEDLLKEKLTPYRQLCPILLDVFIWRKEVYPAVLAGLVTFIFWLVWYVDTSCITTFAVFALIITIIDFLAPLVYSSTSSIETNWSEENEKKFCIFVNRICYYSILLWNTSVSLEEWRKERPNIYSACVIVFLVFIAWLGNAVNNLFLAYIFVLFMVLLPGLLHRRILETYCSQILLTITGALGIKGKKS